MNHTNNIPARILIVDDHPIVRVGIRRLIEADAGLEICAESESPDTALEAARSSKPDLALVDLSLAGRTDLALIRALRDVAADLRILVLSMHDETLFAGRALLAGARGYIMKREAIDGLVRAIRAVLAGDIYVSEKLARTSTSRSRESLAPPCRSPADLTHRELQVFELIGQGNCTAAIAEQLAVSVKTIETYRATIRAKLNLKNGAELARLATIWIEHI